MGNWREGIFMPFTRVLERKKVQTATDWIWTHDANSISDDDKDYGFLENYLHWTGI